MLLRRARDQQQIVLAYHLGCFLDAHIPIWQSGVMRKDMTLNDVYNHGLQPEAQLPLCETTLQDHVISNVGEIFFRSSTKTPFTRLLSKAFGLVFTHRRNGITKAATADAHVSSFVWQCAIVSLLGNYYHARFPSGAAAPCTIEERTVAVAEERILAAVSDVEKLEAIVAEYIAAKVPVYPASTENGVSWAHFVLCAVHTGNTRLRGCTLPSIGAHFPAAQNGATTHNTAPSWSPLAMRTGHRGIGICCRCTAISAYLVSRIRGVQPIKRPVSIFGSAHDQEPLSFCLKCNNRMVFRDMHGLALCLKQDYTIVLCPECNNAHAIEGPVKTTTCERCLYSASEASIAGVGNKRKSDALFCEYDNRRIKGNRYPCINYVINTETCEITKHIVCQFHWKSQNNAITPFTPPCA